MKIAEIFAELSIRDARFRAGLSKARRDLSHFSSVISGSIRLMKQMAVAGGAASCSRGRSGASAALCGC